MPRRVLDYATSRSQRAQTPHGGFSPALVWLNVGSFVVGTLLWLWQHNAGDFGLFFHRPVALAVAVGQLFWSVLPTVAQLTSRKVSWRSGSIMLILAVAGIVLTQWQAVAYWF